MAYDQDFADDDRAIEISAISSIFPEIEIDKSDPFTATLDISVALTSPLLVNFPTAIVAEPPTPPRSDSTSEDHDHSIPVPEVQARSLSHLPPLKLRIQLPEGYPVSKPPRIALTCEEGYLAKEKLKSLENQALILWEEHGQSEVLYDYIDYLQQVAENAFGLGTKDGKAVELPQEIELVLLDFDLKAKQAKFDQGTFDCGVCLEPKKGAKCHKLVLCGHVFCRECLQDFYNNCITEGDVFNVKCMAPKCEGDPSAIPLRPGQRRGKRRKKLDKSLNPSELLQIPLEQEQVQRYVKIKKKKELEANKNTIYCPRKWCQGPARSSAKTVDTADAEDDSDSETEGEKAQEEQKEAPGHEIEKKLPPPSERLAVCTECSYAFCSVCKKSWHGEIVYCLPPRNKKELTVEEKATEDYLDLHSTRCPTCDSRCQKSMGCNHMHCYMCETHFCYLCSAWLSQDNPYHHFNTEGTPCYQRLWEMEEGDNGGAVPHALPVRAVNADARAPNPPVQEVRVEMVRVEEPPPPAPVPPAPPGGANQAPPWEVPANIRVNRRAQQGLARAPRDQNGANPQLALQRFLEMVQDDREDEWDSDEMDDDDWEIPVRAR